MAAIFTVGALVYSSSPAQTDAQGSDSIEFRRLTGPAEEGAPARAIAAPDTVVLDCGERPTVALGALRSWEGELDLGGSRCLEIELEAGAFVRARAEIDGTSPMFGLGFEVWSPDDSTGRSEVSLRSRPTLGPTLNRWPLAWEAQRSGRYVLVLRDLWLWQSDVDSVPARVWIEYVDPPALVQARRDALTRDPRVEWLRRHAAPVRSISPEDDDFHDLEALREALHGVRVVLLGEATHGSGADRRAKTRLVKFLHQEMDFDVLAFEESLYGMKVVQDSLRAGAPGRDSLALGMWGTWANSADLQPLMEYVSAKAKGQSPLVVAGFDNQFMPQGASTRFVDDLVAFLESRKIGGPLVEGGTPERRALESMAVMRFRRGEEPLPPVSVQRALVVALETTASRLAALEGDAEARFRAEVLRGTACHARRVWAEETEDRETPEQCLRDRQMARHLIWLAEERFPGRKIIAWAATAHAMRTDEVVPAAGSGPSMGWGVWQVLGEESYVIAPTSYRGNYGMPWASSPQEVMTDQHPLPEFEELMDAAGFEYGLVDLRRAREQGNWLDGSFLARPEAHLTEQRRWSRYLDALLFIRDQTRRYPAAQPPESGRVPEG